MVVDGTYVAARASGDSVPKLATATAIASSKLFDPVVYETSISLRHGA